MGNIQIPAWIESIYFDRLPPAFKLIGWSVFGLMVAGLLAFIYYGGTQYSVLAQRVWAYPTGAVAMILLAWTIDQRRVLTVPLALVLAICAFATMASPWTIAEGITPKGLIIVTGFFVLALETVAVLAFIVLTMIFWRQGKFPS